MRARSGAHGWLLALCGVLVVLGASQLAVALVNWLVTLRCDAACVAAHGLSRRHSRGSENAGRRADDARERQDHRRYGRSAGSPLPRQSRSPPAFRPADRLRRCPRGHPAVGRRRCSNGPTLRIEELNEKHGAGRGDVFFLLHRPRRYNAGERAWMGFERKRGKLADLNALLRGAPADRFSCIVGHTGVLRHRQVRDHAGLRYPAAARHGPATVGAMMHPLNRPRYDVAKRRVVDGYGILQPRVAGSLTGATRSHYAQLQGNTAGIDPVYAQRLGRLPGPVRRRIVHRQGHLRRRCLRAGAERIAFPTIAS